MNREFSHVSRHRVSFACRDKNCRGMYYNWIVSTSRAVVRHIPLSGNLYPEIRDSTGYSEFQFRRDPIFCKLLRRWYRGRLRSAIPVTSGIHPRDLDLTCPVARVCSGDSPTLERVSKRAILSFVMFSREKRFRSFAVMINWFSNNSE